MAETLNPILDLLGPYQKQVLTFITLMGALRLLAKPISGWLQGLFTKLVLFVQGTPQTDDDAWVERILSSKVYRVLAFLVDWGASIKLPSSDSVKQLATEGTEEKASSPGPLSVWILAGILVLGAGCRGPTAVVDVAPGADPIVVHAEWLAENGAIALDQFLAWERAHQASVSDAIHSAADAIRDTAPGQLRELRRLTKQYKADKTAANGSRVRAATLGLLAVVNLTRAHLGLPAIEPPPDIPALPVGGTLP